MIIFKDILTGDEIISDAYPLKEIDDAVYEIDCKMINVGAEDFALEGANASAEGEDEPTGGDGPEPERKLDVQVAFQWVQDEGGLDKKEYSKHIKAYMKKVMAALKEKGADDAKIEAFQKGAAKYVAKILANYNDYDRYFGMNSEPGEGMYVLVNYREDGVTPYATVWKYGLTEMKV